MLPDNSFPEPQPLQVLEIGNNKDMRNMSTVYSVGNPHPHYMKDPNILNEMGHTVYPKMVYPDGNAQPGIVVKSAQEEEELMKKPIGNQLAEKLGDDIEAMEAKLAQMKAAKERIEAAKPASDGTPKTAW